MKTCRQCDFCIIKGDTIICEKNKNMGVILELDYEKIDIPCHAGEPDTYNLENEYIEPDKETDFGYLEDYYLDDRRNLYESYRFS